MWWGLRTASVSVLTSTRVPEHNRTIIDAITKRTSTKQSIVVENASQECFKSLVVHCCLQLKPMGFTKARCSIYASLTVVLNNVKSLAPAIYNVINA